MERHQDISGEDRKMSAHMKHTHTHTHTNTHESEQRSTLAHQIARHVLFRGATAL